MALNWRPTTAPVQTRCDDIWFITPQFGWGVNSAGQIVHSTLIHGDWVIPGEPDRSMFLVAIIGTGPMQGVMAQSDIQLLTDYIAAGAIVLA